MTNPARWSPKSQARRRRLRRAGVGVAAIAVVVGGVLAGVAVDQHLQRDTTVSGQAAKRQQVDQRAEAEADAAQLHGASQPPATGDPTATDARGSAGAPPAAAVSSITAAGATLAVPALEVTSPIVATGAIGGSMVVPSDIHRVGWYDGIDNRSGGASTTAAHTAPWPGQPGVAILAGHVDWASQGPGALYYLGQLRTGDPIEVTGSNGTTTHWQVSQPPITISKSALPPNLFVNTGPPKLALVTCGGPFDAATGHYLDNVIVWAAQRDAT